MGMKNYPTLIKDIEEMWLWRNKIEIMPLKEHECLKQCGIKIVGKKEFVFYC